MLDTTAKLRQNVIADKITMTLRIEFISPPFFNQLSDAVSGAMHDKNSRLVNDLARRSL